MMSPENKCGHVINIIEFLHLQFNKYEPTKKWIAFVCLLTKQVHAVLLNKKIWAIYGITKIVHLSSSERSIPFLPTVER